MKPELLTIPHAAPTTTSASMKIVFVGNVGSGKTTAIASLSEAPVLGTEVRATERDALHRKDTTTVGIEYGSVHIHNTKLHLYGTPGQHRFDFMASIACQGATGMIVMIDNAHPQPLAEMDYFLQKHGNFLKNHPSIIAITHYDDNNTQTYLIEYHRYLKEHGFSCPIIRLDAREKSQVRQMLEKLHAKIRNHNVAPL